MLSSRQEKPQLQCCEKAEGSVEPLWWEENHFLSSLSKFLCYHFKFFYHMMYHTACNWGIFLKHGWWLENRQKTGTQVSGTLLERELWSVDCSTATVLVYSHQWGVVVVAVASSCLLALGCSLALSVSLWAPRLWGGLLQCEPCGCRNARLEQELINSVAVKYASVMPD